MLNDSIIINRAFGKKILDFIGNPIVTLVLATLTGAYFYLISLNQKIPYYYLSKPVLVADLHPKSLKLTFAKTKISNLYYVDLILWNNGSQFIDHSDFIDSKPILLKSKGSIHFLSSETIFKSRPDIQFSVLTLNDSLCIRMRGDEALEQGDGASFRIYYTRKNVKPAEFILISRVKGTKRGFEYNDFGKTDKATHTKFLEIGWTVVLGLILIRCVILILFKKPIVFRISELIILTLALIILSAYTYNYVYSAIDLNWLKDQQNAQE